MTLPPILEKMQNHLKSCKFKCHQNVQGEGRAASLMDEGMIKKLLKDTFPNNIIDQAPRMMGDILVKDDDGIIYPVNIKTTKGGIDNCFSKGGFVFAFTNLTIEQIPKSMNLKTMKELIDNNRHNDPGKDYWFLCVDKESCSVMIRGAKQIENWVVNINPSNILQINWKLEKQCNPVERTGDEAYDFLIENGVKQSVIRYQRESIPERWTI